LSTVNTWIAWADDEINRTVGYSFSTASAANVVMSTNSSKEIWLPKEYTPLVSVSDVSVNTGTDFDQTWVSKTEGTEFLILDLMTGHIKFSPNTNIRCLEQGVKASFVYGYESVPALVEQLATKLVAKQYIKSAISNTSFSSNEAIRVGPISLENKSGSSVLFVEQLNRDIQELFNKLGTFKTYIY
jgi:hypothetical protein